MKVRESYVFSKIVRRLESATKKTGILKQSGILTFARNYKGYVKELCALLKASEESIPAGLSDLSLNYYVLVFVL